MSDSGNELRYKCIFCNDWVPKSHDQMACSTARDIRLHELLMTKPAEPEMIAHPAHYGGDTPYEAIKVIEAWGLGFCDGNVVKYLSRWRSKGGLEDIRKAIWYLKRFLEEEEQKAGQ